MADPAVVEELCAITGLPADQAETLLRVAGGDLASAVQLHFDQEDGAARAGTAANDAEAAAALAAEEYGDEDELFDRELFDCLPAWKQRQLESLVRLRLPPRPRPTRRNPHQCTVPAPLQLLPPATRGVRCKPECSPGNHDWFGSSDAAKNQDLSSHCFNCGAPRCG